MYEVCSKDGQTLVAKLRRTYSSDDAERAIAEAFATARVASNQNVVGIVDVFTVEQGVVIVLELAAGGDLLSKLVRVMDGVDPCWSPAEVLQYSFQILKGLASIHQAKFTHRDLKPENIFLGANGLIKVSLGKKAFMHTLVFDRLFSDWRLWAGVFGGDEIGGRFSSLHGA